MTDVLEKLRKRDADWQKLCDGWILRIEREGMTMLTTEQVEKLRGTLESEAATEIERLRDRITELENELVWKEV